VKPTFVDFDKLQAGEIVCNDCLFWFDEQSEELAVRTGKDKPQRMRNYSHFVKGGKWIPLSKGDKARMIEVLCEAPFPELAAIAESGQKHIVFRARRNEPGGAAGWIQFEEQAMFVDPVRLARTIEDVEALYVAFNKTEIESNDYIQHRVIKFGIEKWLELNSRLEEVRRDPLHLHLAVFLAQRKETEYGPETDVSRPADDRVAGSAGGLQKPVSDVDLATVRGQHPQRGLHQQPEQGRQYAMWEDTGDGGDPV
jgi:hypothetical protein